MSNSVIFYINNQLEGVEGEAFRNSWFFAPIVWDVLLEKYMKEDIQTPFGYKKTMIMDYGDLQPKLNSIINNCENTSDRICWELSMQQAFSSKDKVVISQAIREFLEQNKWHCLSDEDGEGILTRQHIIERFNEIAEQIEDNDESMYPYFIFKNTSVDDSVESYFNSYDEEQEEYIPRTLDQLDKYLFEIVEIENGCIKGFVPNTEFFRTDKAVIESDQLEYTFKAQDPMEGTWQIIAIEDDFEAIMWGLEHQVDIFTQDERLVYSPGDDEESNFKRLEKYNVRCIDGENGRRWERIDSSPIVNLKHTLVIRTDDPNFKQAISTFLAQHCTKESDLNAMVYELNEKGAKEVMDIVFAK